MGLRFDPMGGGQFQQLTKQLIEIEKQPIVSLENRKAVVNEKLNLFQQFKSTFAGLQSSINEMSNFNSLKELKVDLGGGQDYFNVTLDKTRAQPGTYKIQIDSLANSSGIITNGFEDPDAKDLGIGWIVLHLENGDDFEVFIDEENASLRGVASAINAVKDSPVQAQVIRDVYDPDESWRLIVKAKREGEINAVDFPNFYFMGGDQELYIEEDQDPKNAYLKVDGFDIDTESNNVADFLAGVNLQLLQAAPGREFTLSITPDIAQVSGKMKDLVDNLNQILNFINTQNKVDEKTDTRTTFTGDTGLQSIEYRVRNLLHEGFAVGNPNEDGFRLVHLNQLGVSFTREGNLTFSEDKFKQELERDFDGVAEAISGEFGFAYQLSQLMSTYTRPSDGLLATKEKGMRSQIDQIDRDISFQERIVDRRIEDITRKFSNLQGTLANLQQQQASIGAIGGGSGGGGLQTLLGG